MENLSSLILRAEEGDVDAMVNASYIILFEMPKEEASEELVKQAKNLLNRAILAENDYAMLNTGRFSIMAYTVSKTLQKRYTGIQRLPN